MSNMELKEILEERFKDYKSVSFDFDDTYVYIYLVKVKQSNCTTAQYDYITGLKNVNYQSNGTIRNASKAAASVVITVAKDYPDKLFYLVKK